MFKKFKKFYKYNRIYCILMMISLFCFLLMGTGVIVYFVSQINTSKYGNRLNGINEFNQDEIVNNLENSYTDVKILDKSIRIQGKIIYIELSIEPTTTNEEIQTICTTSLNVISEEVKAFFDLQFIVKREGLSPYMGSKNHSKANITWGNYSFDATTTTTAKKKK